MRRAFFVALVLLIPGRSIRADDAPPPAPPAPPAPPVGPSGREPPNPTPVAPPIQKPPSDPAYQGVRWEREFEAGMRCAVREGRPVFVAVNALVDEVETDNTSLWLEAYSSKAMGDATRVFVNFVANPTAHAVDHAPDGTETCRRYGVGTCAGHQDAMTWVLDHLAGADGAIISPYHAVLDPDGRIVYRGEFMQSCPTVAALETFLVELSPSLALRDVWTSREARLDAITKAEKHALEAEASEWILTKDPMAVAGLVALHEQEKDLFRRGAIRFAIAKAGPSGLSAIEDLADARTATPEVDWDETVAWLDVAIRVEPEFGALSTARAAMRTKSRERREALWARAEKAATFLPTAKAALRVVEVETAALLGQEGVRDELQTLSDAAGWPAARRLRAELRSGVTVVAPRADDRDAVRSWLYESISAGRAVGAEIASKALARPEEEVRVAAALALRVAGDYRGAEVLLGVIADPIEGPEVRAVLSKLAGGDRGDDPAAWADVLTAPTQAGVK